MDAVTALSGSGPAYFFLLVEALIDAGVAAGLSREVAADLTAQTMAGSAAMLLERMDADRHGEAEAPGLRVDATATQLRATVTSPGGTTAAALEGLMAKDGLQPLMIRAIAAATKRSKELAK